MRSLLIVIVRRIPTFSQAVANRLLWPCIESPPHSVPSLPDSNLRLFVSRDGTTTLSGIQLANR